MNFSINCQISTLIIIYFTFFLIFNNIDLNEAKLGRGGGGRISGSRGGSSGSRRGSGGRGGYQSNSLPHVKPKSPVHKPAPPSVNHPSVSNTRPLPNHSPSAPPVNRSPPLSSSNSPFNNNPKKPESFPSSNFNPKDSSSTLIHQESKDSHKPINVPTSQNKPPGYSSNNYPPWANPSINTQFNPALKPSAPQPESRPIGAPPSTYPYPGSLSSAPYPNAYPIGMPQVLNVNHQKSSTLSSNVPSNYGPPPVYGASKNSYGGYEPSPSYHSPSYGQIPSYYQPTGMNQPNYINPSTYSVGGGGGQPFLPGQSTIILPSVSTSNKGPGLGQLVKEALVFSTVNAGVNRLINGAPHHHYDNYYHNADPASISSTVTNNTTIINNNYGSFDKNINQPIGTSNGPYPNNITYFPSGININLNNTPNHINNLNNLSLPYSSNNSINNNNNNNNKSNIKNNENFNSSSSKELIPLNFYYITQNELINLTEKLFSQNEMNSNQQLYILNLQKKVSDVFHIKDEAPQLLLYVDNKVYAYPTVTALRNIYDSYEFNSTKKENTTKISRMNQALFIDTILNTDIMTTAIQWLQEKHYIEPDDFEVKDTLKRIWFSKIDGYTSGFERVFMAEWYPGPSLLGGQNWIYFDYEEYQKKLNYLSYSDKIDINDKISLIKINIEMDQVIKPNVTMLIGTPPELEMALYTICYYVRPNDICQVSLGGIILNIFTHAYRYFGKDLLDLGLIM